MNRVIAHRGASGYAPENTESAIRLAAALGARSIEIDITPTADGHLVLHHDDSLARCSNGTGYVADHTLAELSTLDSGSWFAPEFAGEKIISFEQCLALAQELDLSVNAELKPPFGLETHCAALAIEAINRNVNVEVLFSSFNLIALQALKSIDPASRVAYLIERPGQDWLSRALALGAEAVHVWNHHLPEDISEALQNNLAMRVFTVNDAARAEQLWAQGYASVFTDFPDRLG